MEYNWPCHYFIVSHQNPHIPTSHPRIFNFFACLVDWTYVLNHKQFYLWPYTLRVKSETGKMAVFTWIQGVSVFQATEILYKNSIHALNSNPSVPRCTVDYWFKWTSDTRRGIIPNSLFCFHKYAGQFWGLLIMTSFQQNEYLLIQCIYLNWSRPMYLSHTSYCITVCHRLVCDMKTSRVSLMPQFVNIKRWIWGLGRKKNKDFIMRSYAVSETENINNKP